MEKGVSTSGLLGERLMTDSDPRRNTAAQKTWLYNDDPALSYKINGVPRSAVVKDRSLSLPSEVAADCPESVNHNYRRHALITGDLSTRSGRARAGVFLDEFAH
jgi:hypothetical protein